MTTRQEAIDHWESAKAQFKKERPTRTVVMGDGRGSAASNLLVPGFPLKQYARRRLGDQNYFVIENRRVAPKFNLPVVLGYTDEDPDTEQVLDKSTAGWEFTDSASTIGGVDQHHTQHEFGGGDEVSVDPRLFTPGLVKPQSTPSMKVEVMPFTHHYANWNRFPATTSVDLSSWKPSGTDSRYVLLAVDPVTNTLVYRPGIPSPSSGGFGGIAGAASGGGMGAIPAPAGDEYPLGAVLLNASTTKIDWATVTNNLEETRLHITPPFRRILSRLDQLEGTTGNAADLPATGAGNVGAGGRDAGATSGSNAGNGIGVYKERIGENLVYKTLVGGTNVTLSSAINTITIDSGAGAGEANTAANLGTGLEVFREKSGTTLNLRTIVGGDNVTLSSATSTITVSSTDTSTTGENLGTGIAVLRELSGASMLFKTLVAAGNITLASGASTITITGAANPERHFSVTIGASNTWNNELIPIWQAPSATSVTITEVNGTTSGTTAPALSFNLQHRDWDSMQSAGIDVFAASQVATSAGEQFTSFARATVDPRAHLMLTTGSGAEAGSVNYLQLTVHYK